MSRARLTLAILIKCGGNAGLITGAVVGLLLIFSNVWASESAVVHGVAFFIGFIAAYLCLKTYLKDHGQWPPRLK